MQSITLTIEGMTCVSCENRIERRLRGVRGVQTARVSYSSGTADLTYDETLLCTEEIIAAIEGVGQSDYRATEAKGRKKIKHTEVFGILGIAGVLLALYLLTDRFGIFNIFNAFPQAREGTGYGMLFLIGIMTSLHCVAMCGGLHLSQCVPKERKAGEDRRRAAALTPGLLYHAGRVVSYTVVGGIVGAVGSVVGFSGALKGIVQLAAGVFMVIMGLNMLNVFPSLRRLNPGMPKIFAKKISERKRSRSPLFVGLLNGLMPCGPLQSMQLYALSTGSVIKGALSMLLFSLGTVPLLFGLGALGSLLSRNYTRRMMTASAVLVVVLGVSMFGSGMSLSGVSLPSFPTGAPAGAQSRNVATISGGVQTITTRLFSGKYEPVTVQKGIPVKWVIRAEKTEINGCNNEVVIPEYKIQKKLTAGDNVIEFTPTESGTFAYSCWMGMIRSRISVVDEIGGAAIDASKAGAGRFVPTIRKAVVQK